MGTFLGTFLSKHRFSLNYGRRCVPTRVCPLDLTIGLTELMGGGKTPHPPQAVPLLLAQTLPSVSACADISPLSGEYLKGKV